VSETEFGWPEGQGPIPLKKGPSALTPQERAMLMRRTGNSDVVSNPDPATTKRWQEGDDPSITTSS